MTPGQYDDLSRAAEFPVALFDYGPLVTALRELRGEVSDLESWADRQPETARDLVMTHLVRVHANAAHTALLPDMRAAMLRAPAETAVRLISQFERGTPMGSAVLPALREEFQGGVMWRIPLKGFGLDHHLAAVVVAGLHDAHAARVIRAFTGSDVDPLFDAMLQERVDLAVELHDDVSQRLALVRLSLAALPPSPETEEIEAQITKSWTGFAAWRTPAGTRTTPRS